LLAAISDWDLFLAFLIIDGCTRGKNREPLIWFFKLIVGRVDSIVTVEHVPPESFGRLSTED
jgi:hypothetical protein